MCFEEAFGSKRVYTRGKMPGSRWASQMSQRCHFTWAGHKPSFFFFLSAKSGGKASRASEETRGTLRFSRNCVFIPDVEKQRGGFAIVLGRRGWDFLTREESLSDVSLLVSVLLELCSESVWVATLNRRGCDLQLTGRFKCDRKVLTPKPERQSRVKLIRVRRVALPLLKCEAGPTVSIFIWSTNSLVKLFVQPRISKPP